MLASLRRHPIAIQAHFNFSLVLTFAYPESVLRPLLPPGLELDAYHGDGFVAIAMVQTRGLRPVGMPSLLGRDFFLTGYRIFTRFTLPDDKILRGLKILRSDTDSRTMVAAGNLLTHYNYHLCRAMTRRGEKDMIVEIKTDSGEADLTVRAIFDRPASAPQGSPFPDLTTARHFSGPLPFTFDYEHETHSIVAIQGVRQDWDPQPVSVEIAECRYLEGPAFGGTPIRLANAFWVENIPYRWEPGHVYPLPSRAR